MKILQWKSVYSAHFCESALGAVEHNDFDFYERAPAGSSESIDGTGKIRGMEEGGR